MDSSSRLSFRSAFQLTLRWAQPTHSALRDIVEKVLAEDKNFRRSRLANSEQFNQLVVGELKSQDNQTLQPDFTADLSDITLIQNNLSPRPACEQLLERKSNWERLRLEAKQYSEILGGKRFRVEQFRVRYKAGK